MFEAGRPENDDESDDANNVDLDNSSVGRPMMNPLGTSTDTVTNADDDWF